MTWSTARAPPAPSNASAATLDLRTHRSLQTPRSPGTSPAPPPRRAAPPADAFIHVAVIHPFYLDLILSGRKTIESRFSVTRRVPHGSAFTGERIYFKERSGPVRATALVARVECYQDLTPRRVRELCRDHNQRILGPPEYWQEKSSARFATLLWVVHPEAIHFGPEIPAFCGNAWIRIPADRCVYPRCLAPPPAAPLRSSARPSPGC